MQTYYEIRHYGRSKKFEIYEDAVTHGKALEKLGYNVTLNMVTKSEISTLVTRIYKTKVNK